MLPVLRPCFRLLLLMTAVLMFVLFMTSCRWIGGSPYHVESWTDADGVVHLRLFHKGTGAVPQGRLDHQESSESTEVRYQTPLKEKYEPPDLTEVEMPPDDTTSHRNLKQQNLPLEYTTYPRNRLKEDTTKARQQENYYKLSGVGDKDLLRTLREIEEERRRALEEGAVKPIVEAEIDHRNVQVYDVTREARGDFKCTTIHVRPLTPICLFDPKEDVYVSGTLSRGDVWEQHIVKRFLKVLQLYPEICILDIGANVGQYSLIAANMGYSVLAVEPYLPSLHRFHAAITIGNLSSKIKVLNNAISDRREAVNIKANIDNQGDARLFYQDCHEDQSCYKTKTIFLNDLIPFIPSKQCVLKLDIQGMEHRAFVHASKLLDKISIPYIFMEWAIMREFYVTNPHTSDDKSLVEGMVRLLTGRGYSAYSLVSGRPLDRDFWHGWPEDVLWVQAETGSVSNIDL